MPDAICENVFMFAITVNLDQDSAKRHHPKTINVAMSEICITLKRFGFESQQNSLYTCDNEDLANLFAAMVALKALPWFPASVRDIRAFRVEQWSDFTPFIKS